MQPKGREDEKLSQKSRKWMQLYVKTYKKERRRNSARERINEQKV